MKTVILFLFLLGPTILLAQQNDVKKINFELGLSHSIAAQERGVKNIDYKPGLYFEGRYHLSSHPVNVGLQLDYSTFTRYSKFRSFSILPVADYNFRNGNKVNPFAGLGAGIAFNNLNGVFNDGFQTNFCLMPRVGIRFINHLNLSCDYQLINKDYSHMNLKFGFYW